MIPPLANFKEPNVRINWSTSPVFVNTTPISLIGNREGAPIYIDVSAFGLSGTNVHAVLRNSSPDIIDEHLYDDHKEIHFMALAANTKWSLCEFTKKMWQYFESESTDRSCAKLRNVCYTINTSREQLIFQHRAIVYGSDWSEISQNLMSLHFSINTSSDYTEVTSGYVTTYGKNLEIY